MKGNTVTNPQPAPMSFNPTAVALQATGQNNDDIKQHIERGTGLSTGSIEPGKHYVTFMGKLHVLSDAELHAAMGRV